MADLIIHTAIPVLQIRWENLLADRDACLRHDDVDAVHDLRVSTRRLRTALDLFGPLCNDSHPAHAKNAVRELTRQIGSLRNLDEGLLFFSQQNKEAARQGNKKLFLALLKDLHSRRDKEAAKVQRLLNRLDKSVIEGFLKRIRAGHVKPETCYSDPVKVLSLPGYLSEASIRLYGEVHKFLPPPCAAQDVIQRHALRIAIKRWRYFLEIVAEISQQDYSRNLELLKDYQTLLGHLNDLEVFWDLASECGIHVEERRNLQQVVDGKRDVYLSRLAELAELRPLRYEFFL
ncbi:MAG TPA: CHAD domain-containing protein [Desulfuromonadaceae bacterium]|jgi:CHAD domain-containing protein